MLAIILVYITGVCIAPFVYMFVEWHTMGKIPTDYEETDAFIIVGLMFFSWISVPAGAIIIWMRMIEGFSK